MMVMVIQYLSSVDNHVTWGQVSTLKSLGFLTCQMESWLMAFKCYDSLSYIFFICRNQQ